MIKIDKSVCMQIDGDDFKALLDMAEMARRYFIANKTNSSGTTVAEYDSRETAAVNVLMAKIFSET